MRDNINNNNFILQEDNADYDNNPDEVQNEVKIGQSFVKVDNDYEKKFGRLYKTFDVRYLKSKIWESIDSFSNNQTQLEFKTVIDSMRNSLSQEVIDNISTPTCFVCLLHLANEKSIYL
jgi:hypothetical protein